MKNKKIAIASKEKSKESEISFRGGRAPYYLVFEGEELIETVKNPFAVGGGGAGFSVAHMLADKNVDLVVAGKIGSNMETALKEKEIDFKEMTGKALKVLNKI